MQSSIATDRQLIMVQNIYDIKNKIDIENKSEMYNFIF